MKPSHLSPFQFSQNPDGSPRLDNFPGLKLNTVEDQGTATGRNWQQELAMPHWFEEWEAMAKLKSDQRHGDLKFVLADESKTNLVGHPRLRPKLISLPTVVPLELAHSGFIVGMVYAYVLGIEEGRTALPSWLNVTLPADLEGDFIIGLAQFVDSDLAEKAKEGVRSGAFTHTGPVVFKPEGAPDGSGAVLQVSLVPGDFPGIANAKILTWSA